MSEIKTWQERRETNWEATWSSPQLDASYMQTEIDELRAALAERDAKLAALANQEPVDAVAVEDMDAGTDWRYGRVLMATEDCIKQLYAAAGAAPVPDIAAMVGRFLSWTLPKDFGPDCGISFDGRLDDDWNKNKTWPVGTNLLTAVQAREMLEYVLAAVPKEPT